MADLTWLAKEANSIHGYFMSVFYVLVTVLLLLGVILDYFRIPLGFVPSPGILVGRVFIAGLLLHSYPEISGTMASLSESVAKHLGDLNQFQVVLHRLGDKVGSFTWSWTSVKGSVLLLISFLGFFLLYFSIYIAQAFLMYAWTLLYVFSPVLIALFVLPQTAAATSALYRSLIEVSCWKIVWAVLATLLWSTGASDLDKSTDIVTGLCVNLMFAGSLVLTPFIVHALASSGITSMANSLGGVAVGGLATFTPAKVLGAAAKLGKRSYNSGLDAAEKVTKDRLPKANRALENAWRFRVAKRPPIFTKKKTEKKKGTK